jgi:hypothetical protein
VNPTVTLVETIDEAQDFMRWMGERRPILAIDTETTGLNWWEPHFLRTTQFGDGEQAWVLPQMWWGKLVKDAVEGYTGQIVGTEHQVRGARLRVGGHQDADEQPARHSVPRLAQQSGRACGPQAPQHQAR